MGVHIVHQAGYDELGRIVQEKGIYVKYSYCSRVPYCYANGCCHQSEAFGTNYSDTCCVIKGDVKRKVNRLLRFIS